MAEDPNLPKPDNEEQKEKAIEDLDHLVQEIQDQLSEEDGEVRIVKIKNPKTNWKSQLWMTALSFVFDFILIISINGYLNFMESEILNIAILSVLFSVIDLIFRKIVTQYFFRFIVTSFGLIFIPLMILAFMIAFVITPGVEPISTGRVLIFFFIFIVARSIMKLIFLNKNKLIEIKKVKK